MLIVTMFSVTLLIFTMLSVIMMSVIMLSVTMLTVAAPIILFHSFFNFNFHFQDILIEMQKLILFRERKKKR
jgi:hypothetical protein